MTRPSDHAMKAAESIANYCSTRFPSDNPPCAMLDVPWFAEKVQAAIDSATAQIRGQLQAYEILDAAGCIDRDKHTQPVG